MANTLSRFWRRTRRSMRLLHVNREVLIFALFLLVAIVFWFLQTFRESTTAQLRFKLHITNIPKNVILTSEIPDEVEATVSGRGFSILEYLTKTPHHQIDIDYSAYLNDDGVFVVDQAAWRKILSETLGQDLGLVAVSPSLLELYHSTGDHKYVPVVFEGQVKVDAQHVLCDIIVQPSYVDVYAPEAQFDTITAIRTRNLRLTGLKDTVETTVALQPPVGVKCVPDSVSVSVCVDLYTTKTLRLPIYCENIPVDKVLRTFPMTAEVTFRVSATRYDEITEDDFSLVVDYEAIKPDDEKAKLVMRAQPELIGNVQWTPKEVDYIIEQEDIDDLTTDLP